jgi:CBS domain-containing protein
MTIRDILHAKGSVVLTINEDTTISQATEMFIANQVGSLLVLDNEGRISGIFSERDALRVCHSHQGQCAELKIGELMTKNIIFAEADDDVNYVLGIMTNNRIRHIPVMKDQNLAGIVSIGDLVKNLLNEHQYENKYLLDYIQGNTPKG